MPHKGLSADALDLLAAHHWPGNIRELRNVLEQATLMTDDLLLTAAHFKGVVAGDVSGHADEKSARLAGSASLGLPDATTAEPAETAETASPARAGTRPSAQTLPQAIAELEARAIRDALTATGGNKLAAARLLGISRATLYEKLVLYPPTPPQRPTQKPGPSPAQP